MICMLTTTDSEIRNIGVHITGVRLLVSALNHHAQIKELGLGRWLEVVGTVYLNTPVHTPYLLLMDFYAKFPEKLSCLEVFYLEDPNLKITDYHQLPATFSENKPPNLEWIVLRQGEDEIDIPL